MTILGSSHVRIVWRAERLDGTVEAERIGNRPTTCRKEAEAQAVDALSCGSVKDS
jgi:hypothetical protein